VTGNYVGGTAASCGGAALTFDAGANYDNDLYGIYVSSGTTGACTIQNNTVSNIVFGAKVATANTYSFLGICVAAGYLNVSNNIVGAATGTGAITFAISTTSTRGFAIGGIY